MAILDTRARPTAPEEPDLRAVEHADARRRLRRRALSRGIVSVAAWGAVLLVTSLAPEQPEGGAATTGLLLVVIGSLAVWTLLALRYDGAARRLAYWAPWWWVGAAWIAFWEISTAVTGWLDPPYFPTPQAFVAAAWEDHVLLWRSFWASTRLLLVGYAVGAVSGFFTGVAMGWSKVASYWIHPILQSVGPVPAGALLPLVFVILPTTYSGSIFMIAFGVWFPVAVLTRAGIASVGRGYFDVAQTLGASPRFLIWRVAVPGALPSVFTGLFMGLGASLGALALAELLGVKSGIGWYIQWVKGWADYPKMYVAILVMILFCRTLMVLLFRIRNSVLSWEKDLVRW